MSYYTMSCLTSILDHFTFPGQFTKPGRLTLKLFSLEFINAGQRFLQVVKADWRRFTGCHRWQKLIGECIIAWECVGRKTSIYIRRTDYYYDDNRML